MTERNAYDAIVVGSGPNGLAAAIMLAQANLSVLLIEAKDTIGGGMRSAELTLPGFIHDMCSAIHPLGISSPFFRRLPLAQYGLKWIHPSAPLAHPLDDGSAVILERSIDETSQGFPEDGIAYKKLMEPLVAHWSDLEMDVLAPLHFPRHPLRLASFGFYGIRSAVGLAKSLFKGDRARALFAGLAAHSIMPLERSLTAAFGLILGTIIGAGIGMVGCFSIMLTGHLTSGTITVSFVLVGMCCAYQILAIYKASTYVREHVAGLTTAVANMIIMIFGYAFHTTIGGVINAIGGPSSPQALVYGVAVIPVALSIGTIGFVLLFIKERAEKTAKQALQAHK